MQSQVDSLTPLLYVQHDSLDIAIEVAMNILNNAITSFEHSSRQLLEMVLLRAGVVQEASEIPLRVHVCLHSKSRLEVSCSSPNTLIDWDILTNAL